jgi:hypothetical protein
VSLHTALLTPDEDGGRPPSGWPLPADLHELERIAFLRPGTKAGRTLWLVRRDASEFFIGHVDTPELAELICTGVNRYLKQARGSWS